MSDLALANGALPSPYAPPEQLQVPSQAPGGVPAVPARQPTFWQKVGSGLQSVGKEIGRAVSNASRDVFPGVFGSPSSDPTDQVMTTTLWKLTHPGGGNVRDVLNETVRGRGLFPMTPDQGQVPFIDKGGRQLLADELASDKAGPSSIPTATAEGGGYSGSYMDQLRGFQPPMADYTPQDVTSAAQQPEIAQLLKQVAEMPSTAFGGRPGFLGGIADIIQSMGMAGSGHPELAVSSREAQARAQMAQDVMNRAQAYSFSSALNHYIQRSGQLQEALQTAPIQQRQAAAQALFQKELAPWLAHYNPANRAYIIEQIMGTNPGMTAQEAGALLDSTLNTMGGFQGAINFGNATPNITASQAGK